MLQNCVRFYRAERLYAVRVPLGICRVNSAVPDAAEGSARVLKGPTGKLLSQLCLNQQGPALKGVNEAAVHFFFVGGTIYSKEGVKAAAFGEALQGPSSREGLTLRHLA